MPTIVSLKRRLQGHVQQGGAFSNSDLRSAQGFQSVWENVSFHGSRLSMADLRGSKWVNCRLEGTTFYGGNFNAAGFNGVTVVDGDGEQSSFAGAVLKNVVFRNCRLAYSSFVGASLDNVVFEQCNMHGCSLDLAEANNVSYVGSNLWSAIVPLGCAFWNSTFDVETANRFAAMLARVHPDADAKATLVGIAGDATYNAVCRVMGQRGDGPEPEF